MTEKYNLCFKQLKCDFNVKEIPILEIVVGRGEVQIENNKVKVVKKWKTWNASQSSQISTDILLRTSVIQQNLSTNSRIRRNGNGKINTRKYSKN